jgi:hypothetical protein
MALGSLIKGYTGLAKDVYEKNKPVVDEVKKNIIAPTTPTKNKGETVAPRTPQKPTTVVPPKKEQGQTLEPRTPQVQKTPIVETKVDLPKPITAPKKTESVEPFSSNMDIWEKFNWIEKKWPTISENLKQGTPINTPQALKNKQTKLLEDIKTTKNLDIIREDLSKIQFKTDEERKEFMEPFLRQPGLLESYIPKPKATLFNTIKDAKQYLDAFKNGEFGTSTTEYLEGDNPTAHKVMRSIVETMINDPTKTKEVKNYWVKEYEKTIENPYGGEMEENLYNYLIEKTEHLSIPPKDMTLEQKKEWVEARNQKQSLEKNTNKWKEAMGFYGRPPTEAEIKEMQTQKEAYEKKEKEDFIAKYIQGDMPMNVGTAMNVVINPVQALTSTIFKPKMDYETLSKQYPELAEKAEQEYYKEKEKAYLLSVAESEMDELVKTNIGLRGLIETEKGEAWDIQRLAKKLVQAGTLDIIKPDTLIGKAFKTTYVEDGFLKYNGLIVDTEFETREGQKSAMIADVSTMILGSILPYATISSKIKSTINVLSKTQGSTGNLAKAFLKAQKANPITMEITAINLLEESADATIRKTTGQEYTFNNFLQGMAIGVALGGTMEALGVYFKKVKGLEKVDINEKMLEGVLSDVEKILSYTKNIEDVKDVELAPGVTLFDAFQEQKLAFQNRKGQSMFGESRMIGLKGGKEGVPGVDYPAPITKDVDKDLPEYYGEKEIKDIYFEKDLPKTREGMTESIDDGIEGKPFLADEIDRDGWRYDPEKVDVDFINSKRRDINEANQALDSINKDLENLENPKEIETLLNYRESLIEQIRQTKDEIALRKEYSQVDIQKIQESVSEGELRDAMDIKQVSFRFGDAGGDAMNFIDKFINFLKYPGVKASLMGEKNIGEIKSGRAKRFSAVAGETWQDTVVDLFGDSYTTRDDFRSILETLRGKFKSKNLLGKLDDLMKTMRGGELDADEIWEEIITPGIRQYVDGFKKIPTKEQVETYFKGKTQRGVARSLTKMKDTTKETKKILKDDNFFYEKLKNKSTLDKANKAIKESEEEAFERAVNAENAEDVTIGMVLVKKYQSEGRYDRVSRLLDRMAAKATERGQMNQVFAMFSLLDEAGALRHAVNIMRNMRDSTKRGKLVGKKLEDIADKLSRIINKKFSDTEIKFPKQDVKLEVREILRDAKMTERDINKIVDAIDKKFSNTEIKFPRQDVRMDIEAMLKEVSDEFSFLKKFELSDFEMRNIQNRVKALHEYPEGSLERIFQTKLLIRDMAEIKPPSFLKKVGLYQTASMLLNIKTIARNIIGNAIFGLMETTARSVASAIDVGRVALVRTIGGEASRRVSFSFKDEYKAFAVAAKNIKTNFREVINGVDFRFDESLIKRSSLGLTPGRTFKSGVGKKIEQALGIVLKVPDKFSFDVRFTSDLLGEARLAAMNQKIPKMDRKQFIEDFMKDPPEEAIEKATAHGLYVTFQDNTLLSETLVGFKHLLNFGQSWGIGDFVIKFGKTPANIINRQLAYSPAGFFNMLNPGGKDNLKELFAQGWTKDIKGLPKQYGKTYDIAEAEMALSRALIGSMITYTGYKLASVGILTLASDNRKVEGVEKETGAGYVQFNSSMLGRYIMSGLKDNQEVLPGDKLVSYESLMPIAYQISAGVKLHKEVKSQLSNGKTPDMLHVLGALFGTVLETPDMIMEQPLFTGIKRAFAARSAGQLAQDILKSVPGTFIPTIVNQMRQYVDNVPNETYSPSILQETLNITLNRIPFVHDMKIPYIYDPKNRKSISGENAEMYQNNTNSIFNVFMNPVFVSKLKDDSVYNEYMDLFNKTGETKFMPVKPEKNLSINNVKYKLNADDYEQYQTTQGKLISKLHEETMHSPFYNALSDDEKVKELYANYEDARDISQGEFLYNSVQRGDIILVNLTETYQNKYALYTALYQGGYGDVEGKIYGNAVVERAILKFKNPELYSFANENQEMGQADLGYYMQEAGMEVNKDGTASFGNWQKYKKAALLRKFDDPSTVNLLITTIDNRKSPDENVISTLEKLEDEGKISQSEKEYIYVSVLNSKTLKEMGYLY